jgi:hypothetical protein
MILAQLGGSRVRVRALGASSTGTGLDLAITAVMAGIALGWRRRRLPGCRSVAGGQLVRGPRAGDQGAA